jgi:membrane peptidoglycan carboxypeptidase
MSYLGGVMKRTLSASAARLIPVVRAGLIAGIIVAAVTYPLAAIAGLGTKAGMDLIKNMPRDLRAVAPAQTTYLYANDGKTLLTTFYEEHRKYTPLSQISPYVQQAIIAAEDTRFYRHRGVDARGVARAFVANQSSGGVSQGASTLTMQYVRMALRDGAATPNESLKATEQTSARKIREMRVSVEVEKQMSKAEILERYLNSAYFGHRAYGIYAAAEIFFSKTPRSLTPVEAATLAGLVKSPTEYDPAGADTSGATARRNYVIDRMAAMGYLSPDVAANAQSQPIRLRLSMPPNDCISVPERFNSWGFFCDYIKSWWMSQATFGSNPYERLGKLRRGGYKIVASLDPKIQEIAEKQVLGQLSPDNPFANGLVVVEPGTGTVKAMAVNRIYSFDQSHNGPHSDPEMRSKLKSNYPNTVNMLLGGGDLAGYQAGSTFKMFTMLAALDAGLPLSTEINSPFKVVTIYPDGSRGKTDCGGFWCPTNASGAMTGTHAMWSGFGKSVNTYWVQLEQKVGAHRAVHMAERLGLKWRTDVDQRQASPANAWKWGAFTLGTSDATPLEMATAYAAVAADGRYCQDLPVLSVTGPDGQPAVYTTASGDQLEVAKPRCRQVVSPDVARAATDAARCPTGDKPARGSCGGWSTADSVRGTVGRPVAGKTGTSDSTRAAWFVGYTPELAAASFIADPDSPFHAVGDGMSKVPVDAVASTLHAALEGRPKRDFAPPSEAIS